MCYNLDNSGLFREMKRCEKEDRIKWLKNNPINCKNCGALITKEKCDYCNSSRPSKTA